MKVKEAYRQLPPNAKWSSSFGNPGEGGFTEYWRQPDGTVWVMSNGPWDSIEPVWCCRKEGGQ